MPTGLGLTSALGDLVSSYSHGMRQKLVLISALVHEPVLLVLDEPFVGLDPEASFHVKEMLRELAERGSAVFFSSHVLEVVEKVCDKVAIIKQGKLRACGPTAEVVGDESLEDVFLDMIESDAAQGGTHAADDRTDLRKAPRRQVCRANEAAFAAPLAAMAATAARHRGRPCVRSSCC